MSQNSVFLVVLIQSVITSTPTTTTVTPTTSTVTPTTSTSTTTTLTPSTTSMAPSTCCPSGGVWSEWSTNQKCGDTCGSCAQLTYTRTCISDNTTCPCSGPSSIVRNCNINVCYFPRDTCCGSLTRMVINGSHACGPQPVEPPAPTLPTTCCPTTGFWAPWGSWSGCSGGACGKCGVSTRTRTCFSSQWNCPCVGNTTETMACRVAATWSEWTVAESCPAQPCGSCQFQKLNRTCNKENGCPCFGENTVYRVCNQAPCTGANATTPCCNGYSLMDPNGNGLQTCGPLEPVETVSPPMPCGGNASCCVLGGVWSEWSAGDSCSDICGFCGTTTKTRYCLSDDYGCPCSGPTTKTAECAPTPCLFPRETCCSPRVKLVVGNRFECSKADDSDPPPSDKCWTCCPSSGGYWSEWSTGGGCGDTCGSCAQTTQTRNCLTTAQNCTCKGPATRKVNCNINVCYFPRDSCCAGYSAMVIDGRHACGPQPNYNTTLAPYDPKCEQKCCPDGGTWSEWTQTPAQCSDYCGSCGNVTKTRTCLSEAEGCNCTGPATIQTQCNINVCYFPRLTCCPGYKAMLIEGMTACGPLPELNSTAAAAPDTCGQTCCPTKGIWSEWTTMGQCNDTCGSCGIIPKKRTCLSDDYGCPCTGPAEFDEICATTVCLFPRKSCCGTYVKLINRTANNFYCGPLPTPPPSIIEQTTCCPPSGNGLWSPWTAWSACSATCGLCGSQTRSRTCGSEAYGCPCKGASSETQSCGATACAGSSPCCSGKFLAIGYDGAQFCQNSSPIQCPGTWTDWIQPTNGVCNDTCGNCGIIQSFRYCFPSGCQCPGSFTQNTPCANTVCLFPRASCCAPYVKKISGGKFICG